MRIQDFLRGTDRPRPQVDSLGANQFHFSPSVSKFVLKNKWNNTWKSDVPPCCVKKVKKGDFGQKEPQTLPLKNEQWRTQAESLKTRPHQKRVRIRFFFLASLKMGLIAFEFMLTCLPVWPLHQNFPAQTKRVAANGVAGPLGCRWEPFGQT